MGENKTVKELGEMIDGAGRLSVRAHFVARDGLELKDVGQVVEAMTSDLPVYKEAIEGADQLDDELKDVSGDEALLLLAKVLKWAKLSKRANQGEEPAALFAELAKG